MTTVAIAPAVIATAASAAVTAAGAVYSGIQQKRAADYNAKMSEQNAKAIDVQTREAIRRQREQNRAILSAQRASALTSGVAETGSTLLVAMENARNLERNVTDIATQGNAQRYAAMNQATLSRFQGNAAMTSGILEGTGTLLSGAGQAYKAWKG
jgi:hypothetical protein